MTDDRNETDRDDQKSKDTDDPSRLLGSLAGEPDFRRWVETETRLPQPDVESVIRSAVGGLTRERRLEGKEVQDLKRMLEYRIRFEHAKLLAGSGQWDAFLVAPLFIELARRRFRPRPQSGLQIQHDPRYQYAMSETWERLVDEEKKQQNPVGDPTRFFYSLLSQASRNPPSNPLKKMGELPLETGARFLSLNLLLEIGQERELEGLSEGAATEEEEQLESLRSSQLSEMFWKAIDRLSKYQREALTALVGEEKAIDTARQRKVAENTIYATRNAAKKKLLLLMVEEHGADAVFDVLPSSSKKLPHLSLLRCFEAQLKKSRRRGNPAKQG